MNSRIVLCFLYFTLAIGLALGSRNYHASSPNKGSVNIPHRKLLGVADDLKSDKELNSLLGELAALTGEKDTSKLLESIMKDMEQEPSKKEDNHLQPSQQPQEKRMSDTEQNVLQDNVDEIEDMKKQAGTLLGDPNMFQNEADDAETLEKMLAALQEDVEKNMPGPLHPSPSKNSQDQQPLESNKGAVKTSSPAKKNPSSLPSTKNQKVASAAQADPELNKMLGELSKLTGEDPENLLSGILSDIEKDGQTGSKKSAPKSQTAKTLTKKSTASKPKPKSVKPVATDEIVKIKKEAGTMLGNPDMFAGEADNEDTLFKMLEMLEDDLANKDAKATQEKQASKQPKKALPSKNEQPRNLVNHGGQESQQTPPKIKPKYGPKQNERFTADGPTQLDTVSPDVGKGNPHSNEDQMLMSVDENTIIAQWITDGPSNALLFGVIVGVCTISVVFGVLLVQKHTAMQQASQYNKDTEV